MKVGLPNISNYDEEGYKTIQDAISSSGSVYGDQMTRVRPQQPVPSVRPPSIQHEQPPFQERIPPHTYGPSPHSQASFHQDETSQNDHSVDESLAPDPMGSLYEITRLQKFRRRAPQDERNSTQCHEVLDDFISRGVISIAEAEELLAM